MSEKCPKTLENIASPCSLELPCGQLRWCRLAGWLRPHAPVMPTIGRGRGDAAGSREGAAAWSRRGPAAWLRPWIARQQLAQACQPDLVGHRRGS